MQPHQQTQTQYVPYENLPVEHQIMSMPPQPPQQYYTQHPAPMPFAAPQGVYYYDAQGYPLQHPSYMPMPPPVYYPPPPAPVYPGQHVYYAQQQHVYMANVAPQEPVMPDTLHEQQNNTGGLNNASHVSKVSKASSGPFATSTPFKSTAGYSGDVEDPDVSRISPKSPIRKHGAPLRRHNPVVETPMARKALAYESNHVLPPRSSEPNPLSYKTRPCTQYFKLGSCDYGKECRFAHSMKELEHFKKASQAAREATNPRFKTRVCMSYAPGGSGHCRYGGRCEFLHPTDEGFQRAFNDLAISAARPTSTLENESQEDDSIDYTPPSPPKMKRRGSIGGALNHLHEQSPAIHAFRTKQSIERENHGGFVDDKHDMQRQSRPESRRQPLLQRSVAKLCRAASLMHISRF